MLTRSQVAAHNTRQSCWVIIDDKVYDVTSIIGDHPGGAAAILRHAGKVNAMKRRYCFLLLISDKGRYQRVSSDTPIRYHGQTYSQGYDSVHV